MRILTLLWGMMLCGVASFLGAQGAQPAGQYFIVPAEIWTKDNQTTRVEMQLMVPAQRDDRGTFTLLARNVDQARLVRLRQTNMPEELDVVFGDSAEAFVRVFTGGDSVNYELTGNQMVVEVPYDRNAPGVTRKVQLVDATGLPLTDVRVQVSLHGRFRAYRTKPFEVAVDAEGVVKLPTVVDWLHSREIYRSQPSHLYDVYITDNKTGQVYQAEFMQFAETPVTQLYLPVLHEVDAPGISRAELTLMHVDNTPAVNTTVTVMRSLRAPVSSDVMRHDDAEVIYANIVGPGRDGKITLAFSPQFQFALGAGQELTALIREDYSAASELFPETSTTLRLGVENTVHLPKRLSAMFTLVRANGEAVNAEEQAWSGEWGGVRIIRLHDDCRLNTYQNVGFRTALGRSEDVNTTGVVFQLADIPVPGRYIFENRNVRYGPIELGETSPTQVIRVPEVVESGLLQGRVFDEERQALEGALVVAVKSREDYQAIKNSGGVVTELAGLDTGRSLLRLQEITSGVITFDVTDASGHYAMPRKEMATVSKSMFIVAIASNRIAAQITRLPGECEFELATDMELPDVHLPKRAYVTGSVGAPAMVPDVNNPGTKRPLDPKTDLYRVSVGPSWNWFGQKGLKNSYWQYDTLPTTGTFGSRFRHSVPVGTSVSLSASAVNVPLREHRWPTGMAATAGMEIKVGSVTLHEQYPFKLKVRYANGEPARGLYVRMQGLVERMENGENVQPVLDKNGEIMLFTSWAVTPPIILFNQYRSGLHEEFSGQRLDKSTNPHSVVLTLDAQKWQVLATDEREWVPYR